MVAVALDGGVAERSLRGEILQQGDRTDVDGSSPLISRTACGRRHCDG